VNERQSPDMVSVRVRHKNGAHIFSLKQGKIGQRICFLIDAHACVNNKPLADKFNGKATCTNAASSS
jgi:hypothetical protein